MRRRLEPEQIATDHRFVRAADACEEPELAVGVELAAGEAASEKGISVEQRRAWMHGQERFLTEIGASVRNQRIRPPFQVGRLGQLDLETLADVRRFATVDPGCRL